MTIRHWALRRDAGLEATGCNDFTIHKKCAPGLKCKNAKCILDKGNQKFINDFACTARDKASSWLALCAERIHTAVETYSFSNWAHTYQVCILHTLHGIAIDNKFSVFSLKCYRMSRNWTVLQPDSEIISFSFVVIFFVHTREMLLISIFILYFSESTPSIDGIFFFFFSCVLRVCHALQKPNRPSKYITQLRISTDIMKIGLT